MSERAGQRRRGVLVPTIFAVAGVAVLLGLAKWQLDRRTWKEDLIATLTARIEAPAQALPARAQWPQLDAAKNEYGHVTFSAEFSGDQGALVYTAGSAFRPDVTGAGYWVFAPARLADGSIVVVDRGFVPLERKGLAKTAPGKIDIVGVMRWPEERGTFTPNDEPQNNTWYVRDQRAIAAAKHWGDVAPFYVEQEAPQNPGGFPRAGKLAVALPDNHLQYAITWLLLAGGLAGVYLFWLFGRWRRT
ncbi:MAG TPA: SURF1 family protein [Pseudolabrys sp.]|jgi:surfeit locus 1 family protein|nr:SURF1 family protein [Pseudolabrys sp.]